MRSPLWYDTRAGAPPSLPKGRFAAREEGALVVLVSAARLRYTVPFRWFMLFYAPAGSMDEKTWEGLHECTATAANVC